MNLKCVFRKFLIWLMELPVRTPDAEDHVFGVDAGEVVRFEVGSLRSDVNTAVTEVSSDSGVLTLDFAGKHRAAFVTVLTENVTVDLVNVADDGYLEYRLNVVQDATGGRTLTLPADHHPSGGSDTVIASSAGSATLLAADSLDAAVTWDYAMQERE